MRLFCCNCLAAVQPIDMICILYLTNSTSCRPMLWTYLPHLFLGPAEAV